MRRRLEQLRSLSPWERRMLLKSLLLLSSVGVTLRLLGFKRTRDLLERLATGPLAPGRLVTDSALEIAQRIARLVSVAANNGPYRATCLRQSLALWWLLRRRGIPAELRIGVRKDGKDLNAHAWVEHKDAPLGLDSLGYSPFVDLRFGNPV